MNKTNRHYAKRVIVTGENMTKTMELNHTMTRTSTPASLEQPIWRQFIQDIIQHISSNPDYCMPGKVRRHMQQSVAAMKEEGIQL